jgi:Haemolymph juvenile hormone binding protein (JHBP)
MDINQGGNQSVTIDMKLRNVLLHGLSKGKFYKVSGFEANPEGNKIEIGFKSPLVSVQGPYQVKGRMLILPIEGKGNIKLDLENLDFTLKFLTKKIVKNGKTYIGLEKSKFNFTTTRAQVNFSNLFNGDKLLGDNMNLFLNENWSIVIDELKKPINLAFASEFKDIVSNILENTPYDELFVQ